DGRPGGGAAQGGPGAAPRGGRPAARHAGRRRRQSAGLRPLRSARRRRRRGRPRPAARRRHGRGHLARGLPVRRADVARGVRPHQAAAADRADQAAELGQGAGGEDRPAVRGTRRCRQGRHDQALHRAPQPARRAGRRAGEAQRARAHAVVLPALRRAPAGRRRDPAVRPVLVQPGGRRARHGLLQPARVPRVHAPGAGLRADARALADLPGQVLVLGVPGRAAHPLRGPADRPGAPVEALADGPRLARQVGRLHRGQGGDVLLHRHRRRPVDGRQEQRQEARPARGHALRPARLRLRGQGHRGRGHPRPADHRPWRRPVRAGRARREALPAAV
ncbi:MAG: Polyphosphate kinase 2, partial [uncultured Frankineae bacterium]